jgi:hypothetical protein
MSDAVVLFDVVGTLCSIASGTVRPFQRAVEQAKAMAKNATLAAFHDGPEEDLEAYLGALGLADVVKRRVAGPDARKLVQKELSLAELHGLSGGSEESVRVFVSRNAFVRGRLSELFRPCPSVLLAGGSLEDPFIDYVEFEFSGTRERLRETLKQTAALPAGISGRGERWRAGVFGHRQKLAGLDGIDGIRRESALANVGATDVVETTLGSMLDEEFDRYRAAVEATRLQYFLSREKLVVSMPGDGPDAIPHPPRAPHGHSFLLCAAEVDCVEIEDGRFPALDPKPLTDAERNTLRTLGTDDYSKLLAPLCGLAPLPGSNGRVIDRRRGTTGKDQAFAHLEDCLRGAGLQVSCPPFFTNRKRRWNIEACLGTETGEGIVIVAAHVDSAAEPSTSCPGDRAPGADDNASGVAAVCFSAAAIVELMKQSGGKNLRRQVRFVLFDAEEERMQGSRDYACDLKAGNPGPIPAATMVLDMIGWRDPRDLLAFQVRGPGSYRCICESLSKRSEAIADVVERSAATLAPDYGIRRTDVAKAERDPLACRSDHRSFFDEALPACLITECGTELTGETLEAPFPQFNPAYHTGCDTYVDIVMATDIARVVAGAIWMLVKS